MNTLYNPVFEHENCGIGAVVNIDGLVPAKMPPEKPETV